MEFVPIGRMKVHFAPWPEHRAREEIHRPVTLELEM